MEVPEFADHLVSISHLDMHRDDHDPRWHLGDFAAEHSRRHVERHLGEGCHGVRKAGFQKDCPKPGGSMSDFPQSFRRSGIGPEDNRAFAVVHHISKGWDNVVDLDRVDRQASDFHGHFGLDGTSVKKRRHILGNCYKVRPHPVVENMLLHIVQSLSAPVNTRAVPSGRPCVLKEDWQAPRVVRMRVGEKHVLNAFLILRASPKTKRTRVNRYCPVDQIGCHVLAPGTVLD